MSFQAFTWAADQEPSTMAEKVVLLALANACNGKSGIGNVCFPGQETIAAFARCSVDTVQRALKGLARDGYIRVDKATDSNGQRLHDRYTLLFKITTTAPDGRTKTHAANCGMEGEKTASHAPVAERSKREQNHTANCGMEAENHAANHTANHAANHTAICGPNLKEPREPLKPSAPAGACEAGASPAGAPNRAPRRPEARLTVRRGDASWSDWIDTLSPAVVERAEALGVIEATHRWPTVAGARFLGFPTDPMTGEAA